MENRENQLNSAALLHRQLVQDTLESSRFFMFFSIPPMMWILLSRPCLTPGVFTGLMTFVCGLIWYGCWRLWLDTRYLRAIDEKNNHLAGEALFFIWQRKKLQSLTFAQRQAGALKQYKLTMLLTGILWLIWVVVLVAR
ncbi:hypothetical protein [Pseudocitrobacter sp. 73]|uniref:hypothetical protein n=1 Tax=Pseudocitrobacter sp. 73 TaxID=2605731 RepID=UPI0011EBEA75|nr:hypothetical protein [Pseudocitrobacter sp. 73]KAA1050708.1 hypothetical protein F0Q32_05990 [Pseudocitrobacter sp. 73]